MRYCLFFLLRVTCAVSVVCFILPAGQCKSYTTWRAQRHKVSPDEVRGLPEFREQGPNRRGLEWRPITYRQMAWDCHLPGDGGWEETLSCREQVTGIVWNWPSPACKQNPSPAAKVPHSAGAVGPLVMQWGLWLTNSATCILFQLIAILEECLKLTNCTSFVCEFCLRRIFSGFFQLFSDVPDMKPLLLAEPENAEGRGNVKS